MIAISCTYDRCGEEWLRELARILKEQDTDYPSLDDRIAYGRIKCKRPALRRAFCV